MTRKNDLLTASKVSQKLDISTRTLDNWYKFYTGDFDHPDDMPTLPEYIQESVRGPRYWKPEDIKTLKKFKEWIPRGRGGVMGRLNERYWSAEHRQNNKEADKTDNT